MSNEDVIAADWECSRTDGIYSFPLDMPAFHARLQTGTGPFRSNSSSFGPNLHLVAVAGRRPRTIRDPLDCMATVGRRRTSLDLLFLANLVGA